MTELYPLNDTVTILSIFRDQDKLPITTADGKVTIQRVADGLYWDGDSFETAATLLQMVKVGDGDTNSPGRWQYDFDTDGQDAALYLIVVTDGNSLAVNVPQQNDANVGDGIALMIEYASAGGVARGKYDATASTFTLYRSDDPTTILQVFDVKDAAGDPAGSGSRFEMVPQ